MAGPCPSWETMPCSPRISIGDNFSHCKRVQPCGLWENMKYNYITRFNDVADFVTVMAGFSCSKTVSSPGVATVSTR